MSAVDMVLGAAEGFLGGVKLKETAVVRLLGIRNIPLLFVMRPRVLRLDEDGCELQIRLNYWTKNHVGIMYVAALAGGADLASGLNAASLIWSRHRKVELLFKHMNAEFLKRADGDVHFHCTQGREIGDLVRKADETGERFTMPVNVTATVPRKYGDEVVARFTMGLSLRRKG